MRQIVLDTETTGLELADGHRIIEVGCVELINRRHTGRHFHQYVNPEREIDFAAGAVHGLTREQLSTAPKFADIAEPLLTFIAGSELIIHNAEFDLAFLDRELALAGASGPVSSALPASVRTVCQVLDTLSLARARHPGQRNNLDALCRRYDIANSHRELHGALLDARLLADVYLAMTGGQSLLALEEGAQLREGGVAGLAGLEALPAVSVRPTLPLRVLAASADELAAHARLTALLQEASAGRCLWLRWQGPAPPSPLPASEERSAATV